MLNRLMIATILASTAFAQGAMAKTVKLAHPSAIMAEACDTMNIQCTDQSPMRILHESSLKAPREIVRIARPTQTTPTTSVRQAAMLGSILKARKTGADGQYFEGQELETELVVIAALEAPLRPLVTPLPAAAPLMLLGLAGLAAMRRRNAL